MGGHESLRSPSTVAVEVLDQTYAESGRHELRELYPNSPDTSLKLTSAPGADVPSSRAAELVDELRLEAAAETTEAIPERNRFAAWSRRYLIILAIFDAVMGGLAAATPASISNTLSGWPNAVPVLDLIGMVVWPTAIGLR